MGRGAVALKRGPGGKLGSARSKTGDPQCSAAMSAKVNARYGNPISMALDVANKILGMCRAKAAAFGKSRSHEVAGNTAKSQVWAKRAERGLSGKGRMDEAKRLKGERAAAKAKPAAATPKPQVQDKAGWAERARLLAERNNLRSLRRKQGKLKADVATHFASESKAGPPGDVAQRAKLHQRADKLAGDVGKATTPKPSLREQAAAPPRLSARERNQARLDKIPDARYGGGAGGQRVGLPGQPRPGGMGPTMRERAGIAASGRPFHEQVQHAASKVPADKLRGGKALLHHVHEAHQADPGNPRMSLDTFKARTVEHKDKLSLARHDMVQTIAPADLAKSDAHFKMGGKTAATFNYVKVEGKGPSLREQAAKHRASKGDRLQRIEGLYSKSTAKSNVMRTQREAMEQEARTLPTGFSQAKGQKRLVAKRLELERAAHKNRRKAEPNEGRKGRLSVERDRLRSEARKRGQYSFP